VSVRERLARRVRVGGERIPNGVDPDDADDGHLMSATRDSGDFVSGLAASALRCFGAQAKINKASTHSSHKTDAAV